MKAATPIKDRFRSEAVRYSLRRTAEAVATHENSPWRNERIIGRIAEIDGLRGLAILLVLVFHYIVSVSAPRHPVWALVTQGGTLFWSGVDLFFVLSGFLISGILLDSVHSKSYFKTFYLRRIHRIFPLYFAWLALFYAGVYLQMDRKFGVHIFESRAPLWLYPMFLQNNAPLLLNLELPLWMAMSWSLAVEEQFYFVLPTIIRFISKRALGFVCGSVIIMSPIYRYFLVMRAPALNIGWPFATFSRLDGLAWGAALALFMRNETCWRWLRRSIHPLRIAAVSLFVVIATLTYRPQGEVRIALYGFSIISAFYALLLVLAVCEPQSRLGVILRSRLLQYVGTVSYAIYIFHQGIRGLVEWILSPFHGVLNSMHVVVVTILALGATVLLSQISWLIVEKALIRRAHLRYTYS